MPLVRGHHSFDDHFTQIPNDWVRDSRLSFKARGLLAELMSHKSGWSISIKTLSNGKDGAHAIRAAVNELMEFGYLIRSDKRQRNDAGQLTDYVYTTCDPVVAKNSEIIGEKPTFGFPTLGFPTLDNQEHKNTIHKENYLKEIRTTDLVAQAYSDEFLSWWKIYPRRQQKGDAWKAWQQLVKKKQLPSLDVLLDATSRYAKRVDDPKFVKLPGGWLRAAMWDDEPLTTTTERKRITGYAD